VVSYEQFIAFRDFGLTFSCADRSLVEGILEDCHVDCPDMVWTSRRDRAVILLAAHRVRLYINGQEMGGLARGAITALSASQESQSVSFAQANLEQDPEALDSTIYGREFKRLQKGLATVRGGTFVRI
jgi:hypothetical protein